MFWAAFDTSRDISSGLGAPREISGRGILQPQAVMVWPQNHAGWCFQPLWKYESLGMIIQNLWEHKQCSKPPTSCSTHKSSRQTFSRGGLGALRSKVTGVALHLIALLHYTVKTCQSLSDTHDGFLMPQYWPSSTLPSLGSLQNGLQLLGQHHVALDLQLATHECLHSVQLAFRHGHQVRICHSDGAILTASRTQVIASQLVPVCASSSFLCHLRMREIMSKFQNVQWSTVIAVLLLKFSCWPRLLHLLWQHHCRSSNQGRTCPPDQRRWWWTGTPWSNWVNLHEISFDWDLCV